MTGRTVADAAGSAVSATDPGGPLRVYEAASTYYIRGETVGVIAHHLGVSRLTVSRPLACVCQEDAARVSLVQSGGVGSLEGWMVQVFEVRTYIVSVRGGTMEVHRLEQVASVAVTRIVDFIETLAEPGQGRGVGAPESGGPEGDKPPATDEPVGSSRDADAGGVVAGVAWGTTTSEASAALPSRSVPGLTVVQFSGVSDPVRKGPSVGEALSRMCLLLGARTISFPVPTFFDHATTREAMWSERSVKRALSAMRRVSLTIFGVGALDALNGALPPQVYEGGHLIARDRAVLRRQNVVGNVCTVLLRVDGSWRDATLDAQATGPTPARLARTPHRPCVATRTGKSRALLVALRTRTATDFVVDDAAARAVLELAEVCDQRGGGSR